MFPCDRWLARDEDDGALERELVATKVTEEFTRGDGTVKKKDRKLDNVLEGETLLLLLLLHAFFYFDWLYAAEMLADII